MDTYEYPINQKSVKMTKIYEKELLSGDLDGWKTKTDLVNKNQSKSTINNRLPFQNVTYKSRVLSPGPNPYKDK